MTEQHIQHARIATELSRLTGPARQVRAQQYLVAGCLSLDRVLIDIGLGFGGDFLLPDSRGITPITILSNAEKAKKRENPQVPPKNDLPKKKK